MRSLKSKAGSHIKDNTADLPKSDSCTSRRSSTVDKYQVLEGTRRYQNLVPQLTGNNVKNLMSLFEKRGSSVWNADLGFLMFFGILIPFQIFKSNTVFYCKNEVKQSLNTKTKLELEIWDTANCFCFRPFFSSRYFRKVWKVIFREIT